jgi:hypothetical protein
MSSDEPSLRLRRIERDETHSHDNLEVSTIAVKALSALVQMPQDELGSRTAIEHWRGLSRHSPIAESIFSQLGFRVQKV